MTRDSKTMEVLQMYAANATWNEYLYDALAAAGCLLTPEAREVIEAHLEHPNSERSRLARNAHRVATEPPKLAAYHGGTYSQALLGSTVVAIFYGPTRRADCEAWVAMKNGGRA
jgi:hypothetical protein